MRASGKISVALTADQLGRVWDAVECGEFDSPGAVLREALLAWLDARTEAAGRHAAISRRIGRSFGGAADGLQPAEPAERVELLFDARDAKA
jgi:Arc/MetJ-type ribon-helix-helix transcriptional regulator